MSKKKPCRHCDGKGWKWPTGQDAESEAGLLPMRCVACDGSGEHVSWWRRLLRRRRR